ncbi:MAG: hypothetical protein CMN73_04440 [Sphingomonas sp.]|nr:hypothetical protein [Sphingomonas sp.]|tara:strand:+ start:983 stop:1543 length:561 start_codon:yes stop_codon:yes gene_type:complete
MIAETIASAVWGFVARNWRWALPLLVAAGLFTALSITRHTLAGVREDLGDEKAAHAQTIANYRAAQDAALAEAIAQRDRLQDQYQLAAERADYAETQLAAARSAADRFADARSVRTYCTPIGGSTSGPAAAGESDATARNNRPDADAVVLTRGEYDIFVRNTLRLKQAHDWGMNLIADGLAVKLAE